MEYKQKLYELGITLDKSGKQTCPQCSHTRHNKSDKSLSVTYSTDAVLYNCHHCGWKGAVFYRSKTEKKTNYTKPSMPKVADKLDYLYSYFANRGISKKTLDEYRITLNDRNEIVIPYYKNDELVNIKYRTNLENGKKTFRQEKDAEKTLFGIDLVDTASEELIWVEGEMDVLALAEVGIRSVSIPIGAKDSKLECIENCFYKVDKFKTHIIAVDNDEAGDILKANLLQRLGKNNCKIVNWKQYKDANEVLIAGEDLNAFIDNAQYLAPDGIVTFEDSYDEIFQLNYGEEEKFYNTGWESLDRLIKLRLGHLMVVTGYPSRGKSTFVDNLCMNLSKKYGLTHLIASLESTNAIHYNTLLEMYEEKPIFEIKKENNIFGEGFNFINKHFIRFDVDVYWSIDEVLKQAELGVRKYGANTLILDPYNRFDNKITDNREDRFVGKILSKCSMFAKKFNCLVVFVAHPKKPDGEKIPNMYSISGSGDWYNMCDYGIVVHRDRGADNKLSNFPTVMVQKVKNFALGSPSGGEITLKYDTRKRVLGC